MAAGYAALSLAQDDAIPAFRKLAPDQTGKEQAWNPAYHGGADAFPLFLDGKDPIAPSRYFSVQRVTPAEMTIEDIRTYRKPSPERHSGAQEAGFDGVEILGISPVTESRNFFLHSKQESDNYGGNFENRTRFVRELLELVRLRLGDIIP